ncbi:MAG: hypothetical protein Q4F41_09345 [Eubacteriales bacterium]|nr:hypothetical protein [Eubacteriales bacterium]
MAIEKTKVSKAQQKAVAKYMKNNYDEIKIRVEKGEKPIIQEHAQTMGESTNTFIRRAIKETMEHDRGQVKTETEA